MRLTIQNKAKKDIFVFLFQQLKQATKTVSLLFNEDHVYIQGMDGSHVCLFEVKMFQAWFDTYDYEVKRTVAVDAAVLFQILSICGEKQTLTVYYEENSEEEVLNIEFTNPESQKENQEFDKYFRLPLIDYDGDILEIPETDYDVEFSLPSKKIQELVSQMSMFGSSAKITCSEEKLMIGTEGINGVMNVVISWDDINEYSICEGETVESSFILNHLNKICIHTRLSKVIAFSMKKEFPMLIHYDIGDASFINFYVVPQIDNDS